MDSLCAARYATFFIVKRRGNKKQYVNAFPLADRPGFDTRYLARLGYCYEGDGDFLRCAHCNIRLGEWNEGDCVVKEHVRLMPACTHFQQIAKGMST